MDTVTLVTEVVKKVLREMSKAQTVDKFENSVGYNRLSPENLQIPVAISNRHVHLCGQDIKTLFGPSAELTKLKDLSQPGQFACNETVTLVGPKGVLEKVRVLGPSRKQSQVEISISDCFKLGVKAPLRDSGDLKGSAGITIVGPVGSVTLAEGCIIATRHIHMHTKDALKLGLSDGDRANVKAPGPRSVTYGEVLVRVSDKYKLEMHVDMDEGNAVGLKNGDMVIIC